MTARDDGGTVGPEVWRDRWIASYRSPRTRETYADSFGRWLAFLAAVGVHPWDVEPHHLDAYGASLAGAHATIARHLSTVSSFYRLVLRRARPCPILANPARDIDRPKVDTVSRRAGLTLTQAKQLRAASIEKSPRTAALVHLLLATGMRASEAVGGKVDGLGWAGTSRTLAIVRKGDAPDVATIPAGDWVVIDRYLTERPEVPDGWLFATTGGRQMTRQTAYRLIRAVADPIVPDRVKIGTHSLRHTVATLALNAGQPIQEVQGLLRHSSSATTQRYDRDAQQRGQGAARAIADLWATP